MAEGQTGTRQRIRVEIAPDEMQAWVRLDGDRRDLQPTPAEILSILNETRIAIDEEVRSRVEALVEALSTGAPLPDRFLVAQGSPAEDAQPGAFVLDQKLRAVHGLQHSGGAVNYFEISNVVTCNIGDVIGRIIPPKAGRAGVDVHGMPVRPKGSSTPVQSGSGVEVSPADQSSVISRVAGRILCEGGTISVVETLEVKGDVDFKTGSIDSSVEVHVTGNIRDNFQVRSEKSVTVGGCIEQATVFAQEDVVVRNGILGRGKGVVTAGGRCIAKFCEGAVLISTGDVQVAREVMNSSIYTEGTLSIPRGSLVGGSTYARQSVEVAVLGKACGTGTEVFVGIHPGTLEKVRIIDEGLKVRKAMLEETAQRIRPLVDDLKRLTPDLKKQVAESVPRLRSMKQAIAETQQSRQAILASAAPSNTPSVLVSKVVHEGVRIQIGYHECRLDRELKGPVRIELRKVNNITRFVAVNQLTGSIILLPTRRVEVGSVLATCPTREDEAPSQEPSGVKTVAVSS